MMSSENDCVHSNLWISVSRGRIWLRVTEMMCQTPALRMTLILTTVLLLRQVWTFLTPPCLGSLADTRVLTSEDDSGTARPVGDTGSGLGAILIFSGGCESNRMQDRRNTTPDFDSGSKVPHHPWLTTRLKQKCTRTDNICYTNYLQHLFYHYS